jgi:hypothetical protein
MSVVSRIAVSTVAAALVATTAFAQVARVKCESTNDKYKYCSAKTDGQVRMIEQVSDARCEQGMSWGYDKQGVWVDHNCSAEFEVGRSGPSTSEKVMAGATAGVAILQAMMAGSQPAAAAPAAAEATPAAAFPGGTFQATHPKSGQQYYLTVDGAGSVEGRVNDKSFFGKVKGNQIYVCAAAFSFRPDGDGVLVYQAGKESEGVRFTRVK